jgi:hypothetical protein
MSTLPPYNVFAAWLASPVSGTAVLKVLRALGRPLYLHHCLRLQSQTAKKGESSRVWSFAKRGGALYFTAEKEQECPGHFNDSGDAHKRAWIWPPLQTVPAVVILVFVISLVTHTYTGVGTHMGAGFFGAKGHGDMRS